MAKNGFWKEEEVQLITAWLADLTELGYQPPEVQNKFQNQDANQGADQGRQHLAVEYVVCITGQADCSAFAVPANT